MATNPGQQHGSHEFDPELDGQAERHPDPVRSGEKHEPTAAEFIAVEQTPEFRELRGRFQKFAFPMTGAFLVWYFAYVLTSTYAPKFMTTKLFGSMTIGLVWGVLQFVTTFLLTWLYIRHANKNLDPIASRLKAQLEGDVQ